MKSNISVLIITKNNEDTIVKTLSSVKKFVNEIIVVDGGSSDGTLRIVKRYTNIYFSKHFNDIGEQRAYGLKKSIGEWVLILDSDEIITNDLKNEILKRVKGNETAFLIPYQNYFLSKKIHYGGEDYKMLRLIKRKFLKIKPSIVHNKFSITKGKTGTLKNKIHHYSYRSLGQMFTKFTDYAIKMAKVKAEEGERSSLKKILMYPPHMFYARFIKDKGYKDGMFRIPLDLAFAYMEFLTYLLLIFKKPVNRSG